MSSRGRLVATAGGVAAAGLGLGIGASVAVPRQLAQRSRRGVDPAADEDFRRTTDSSRRVVADDGVPLYVEQTGRADAPVTVVLVHGYANDARIWHYPWRDLGGEVRLVRYDQRGHGRSGRPHPESCTMRQVARDLRSVLDAVVPDGPVVVVGHSMGGMALLALVGDEPGLVGERIVGVGLVSTSAGRLRDITLGLPWRLGAVGHRVLPVAASFARDHASAVERVRRLASDATYLLTRHYGFGDRPQASPALVDLVESMNASTPVEVLAAFYPTFVEHDETAALPALTGIPSLVLVGAQDLLTPPEHAATMAALLPGCQHVVVPHAGHMVPLEQGDVVTAQLRALLARVAERT